jgi:hypothetical protein
MTTLETWGDNRVSSNNKGERAKKRKGDVRAHEDLNGPNVVQGDLEALSGSLVETEGVPQLVLRDSSGRVNLVAEDEEGNLFERHTQAKNEAIVCQLNFWLPKMRV